MAKDLDESLPILKSWGLEYVDLRTKVLGSAFEDLNKDELLNVRKRLDDHGLKVACLQSSLAKVHLPDQERQKAEKAKLERIIVAADILNCRLVRGFFYWQPGQELKGKLVNLPEEQSKLMELFSPLAERAKQAELTFGFENCGVFHDEVLVMLERFGIKNWGLAWDVTNTWECEEKKKDENSFIRKMVSKAILIHVKAKGSVYKSENGLIPYDKILKTCSELDFTGPVSVETHNPNPKLTPEIMSKQIVDYLQGIW